MEVKPMSLLQNSKPAISELFQQLSKEQDQVFSAQDVERNSLERLISCESLTEI